MVLARRESFTLSCLRGGVARGALTEIAGPDGGGKTEIVLRFLAENPSVRVAWIEQGFSIYPCAFPQRGVSLERVLFIRDPGEHAVWCAQQALRSGIFPVVVLKAKLEGMLPLRRLQLAAERAHSAVLLLAEKCRRGAWAIGRQLEVRRRERTLEVGELKARDLWVAHG